MANDKPPKPQGEKITKAEAEKMTKAYQARNKDKTRSVAFSADFVRNMVNNPIADIVVLRFAEVDSGEDSIVISTLDASGNTLEDGDRGQLCPPYCQ
jgi:hypothetical protein